MFCFSGLLAQLNLPGVYIQNLGLLSGFLLSRISPSFSNSCSCPKFCPLFFQARKIEDTNPPDADWGLPWDRKLCNVGNSPNAISFFWVSAPLQYPPIIMLQCLQFSCLVYFVYNVLLSSQGGLAWKELLRHSQKQIKDCLVLNIKRGLQTGLQSRKERDKNGRGRERRDKNKI